MRNLMKRCLKALGGHSKDSAKSLPGSVSIYEEILSSRRRRDRQDQRVYRGRIRRVLDHGA